MRLKCYALRQSHNLKSHILQRIEFTIALMFSVASKIDKACALPLVDFDVDVYDDDFTIFISGEFVPSNFFAHKYFYST